MASGRLPRNNGGIAAANPKTSDRLLIVLLDDIKFSEEWHLRGRTLLIRKLGRSDATNDVRDGSSHTKIASESMISY